MEKRNATQGSSSSIDLLHYGIDVPAKTLVLTGPVDSEMLWTINTGIRRIAPKAGDTMTFELSTPGGCLYNGLGIYDTLRRLRDERGVKVRIIGIGYVMSMGVTVLQAASAGERLLLPNTSVMIHQGHETSPPEIHPEERKRLTKEFDRVARLTFNILAEAQGMSFTAWKKAHQYDTYFDASGAVAAGLADRVYQEVAGGRKARK